VIVRQSPYSSALRRAARGEAADYGVPEYLLAGILNGIRVLSHQMDGRKRKPDPELFYPPGVRDPKKVTHSDVMTIDEMNQRLGWT
jgi:hypothetical protein